MAHFETLEIERSGRVATIWMNRPAVFNAFDEQLIDELHAHKTRGVWDVMRSAMGARRHPLLLAITWDLSFTWLASHKRLAISGAGPSAAANSGVAVSPTLVASSCTTPFSTLITRPSGQGNPACRPGPNTSTGLPKRS